MDWNTPDLNSWPAKLVTRIGKKIRSNRSFTQESITRQKEKDDARWRKRSNAHPRPSGDTTSQADVNELGEREYTGFSQASTLIDNKDHTDMMHGLAHHDSFDSLVDEPRMLEKLRDPYCSSETHGTLASYPVSEEDEKRVAALPDEIWERIASFLDTVSAASLAISSKTLLLKLGSGPADTLNDAENKHPKAHFLLQRDHTLPNHLLCFSCVRYHKRSQAGKEMLKVDYVSNALYDCPNVRNSVLPRLRLTYGRELPYAFVQLAIRAEKHGPLHGINADSLSRRWKCKDSGWTHRTRYMVHDGRLLMRVVSQTHVPPAAGLTATSERHILYDREEYTPFFSVCTHWKDGELMRLCKCALSHVPSPPDPYHRQLSRGFKVSRAAANPNFIVRMCDECRPARRCPECPTEYLLEIQMVEDPKDRVTPFKHTMVVTRWSDLGNGSNPLTSPEWSAVKGLDTATGYGSFSHVGRRAVGGIFDSRVSGSIPGQRMLSLNPKNAKLGEDGHGWY